MLAEILVLALVAAGSSEAETPSEIPPDPPPARWLGADGEALPFSTHDAIVEFLRDAEIVEQKVLGSGSTKPLKVTLERDGVRAHAVFRHVDESNGGGRQQFRDSYIFEVAAYEVARLLGLDNVPPAALRRHENKEGSIQLWIENARSETERIEAGEQPADATSLLYQKHAMRIFDALIYNFDRNTGNLLLDERGKLWLIDHTRAFKRQPKLPDPDALVVCERELWQRLRALDPKALRERAAPYLDALQANALAERHAALVEHFADLIESKGEDAVLFDLD